MHFLVSVNIVMYKEADIYHFITDPKLHNYRKDNY